MGLSQKCITSPLTIACLDTSTLRPCSVQASLVQASSANVALSGVSSRKAEAEVDRSLLRQPLKNNYPLSLSLN